jgi:hypothetical protein
MPSVTIDSLVANEFAFEINGQKVNGVFHIAKLTSFSLDDQGRFAPKPFEVSKLVERDPNNAFNTWLRETLEARHDPAKRPIRDVTIVAVDDGIETRRWTAKNAWIHAIHYSNFDSSSFEMVGETYEIMFEDLEQSFPQGN